MKVMVSVNSEEQTTSNPKPDEKPVKMVTRDDMDDIRRIACDIMQKYPNTMKLLEDN